MTDDWYTRLGLNPPKYQIQYLIAKKIVTTKSSGDIEFKGFALDQF